MTRTPEPAPLDNAEIVERVANAINIALLTIEHGVRVCELTDDELAHLARAAIRALATPIQGEI